MSSKERYKLIVSIYVFFVREGKTLLARRCNTGYCDGQYSLIAGHLEPDESVTEGIIREAAEEAGVTLSPEKLEVVHTMHRRTDDERVDFFFVARDWEGEIHIAEPEKCDDLLWAPIDALPDNTIPYIRQALECFTAGRLYSEYGWDRS